MSRDTPNATATIALSAATGEHLEDVHVSMCVRFTGTAGVASPRVVCLAESTTSTTRASFTLRTMNFSEQDASSQCRVSRCKHRSEPCRSKPLLELGAIVQLSAVMNRWDEQDDASEELEAEIACYIS